MFKVYDKDAQDNATYLKLLPAYGGVKLAVCNKAGIPEAKGNILSITDKGTVLLYSGINSGAPLQLDERGRIKLEVDGETVSLSNLTDNARLERRLEETQRQLKVARDQLAETEAKLAKTETERDTAKEALMLVKVQLDDMKRERECGGIQSYTYEEATKGHCLCPVTASVSSGDVEYCPYPDSGGRLCQHIGSGRWSFEPLTRDDAKELALALLKTC